jgi:hypothetical protein
VYQVGCGLESKIVSTVSPFLEGVEGSLVFAWQAYWAQWRNAWRRRTSWIR